MGNQNRQPGELWDFKLKAVNRAASPGKLGRLRTKKKRTADLACPLIAWVKQANGFDHGCPLSPMFFVIAICKAVEASEDNMMQIDPLAWVRGFLDDTYFVGTPDAVEVGIETYKRELGKLGLRLNAGKNKAVGAGIRGRHFAPGL